MSKQNAVDLARTARSEAESITKGDKRTIAAIITNWNECVKQAGFWCIYDFPTTGYTRKSQLVADMLRCADQLDEYVEPTPHAPQTVEQQIREFNAALTRVLDVEEAHAVAIDVNAWIDSLTCQKTGADVVLFEIREQDHEEALKENNRFTWLANRWSLFWVGTDYFTRRTMIEEAHAEALRIDPQKDATPVTCSIFQRNDGVQVALDSSCDVRFIRTRKNGEWFKAGFSITDMEGYQPVESDALFTVIPSRTISFSEGVMVISEA
ncbi:hypothetical protein N4G41_03630 [Kosakonia sacchari]|uniref:hypothetical protein n=1 Tax=Kosakonia sacchari TaxID=1158459 RepID=UPI002ACD3DEF|nr:hypothetical protein [Kosakonia sacchari]MDZ7320719.1 hypothetical protein [Kosakonia sacchari]